MIEGGTLGGVGVAAQGHRGLQAPRGGVAALARGVLQPGRGVIGAARTAQAAKVGP